jgi:hypothetical protein
VLGATPGFWGGGGGGGRPFETQLGRQLSWLGFLTIFLTPPGKEQNMPQLGYDCFLPHALQLMNHPAGRHYTVQMTPSCKSTSIPVTLCTQHCLVLYSKPRQLLQKTLVTITDHVRLNSPVSMLSLTMQFPVRRAASQCITHP